MNVYGRTLSDVTEIPEIYLRKQPGNFLIGEGGNLHAYKVHPKLYIKPWKNKVYLNLKDFSKNTLVLGSMGSGKSNLLKYLSKVFEVNMLKQVIHDVKGEYVELFYNEEKDLIFNIYDTRGFFWDFLSDFSEDTNLAYTCLKSMCLTYSKDTKDIFWVEKAVEFLLEVFSEVSIKSVINKEDALSALEEIREIFNQKTNAAKGETALSAAGTASPALKALMEALYIFGNSEFERKTFTVDEIVDTFSRLYLVFIPEFAEKTQILNSGLLTALFLRYLSRRDVLDVNEYVVFLLDEYLSFKFTQELELQVFTLARSKGLCLIVAMQYLPSGEKESDRRKILTSSRFHTFAFRVADLDTAKWLAELSGEIEVDYDVLHFSDSMNLQVNPLHGGGVSTGYSRVKTYNFRYEDFLSLEQFVAFLSIEDRYKFFIKPVWFDVTEKRAEGFIRDEVSYQVRF